MLNDDKLYFTHAERTAVNILDSLEKRKLGFDMLDESTMQEITDEIIEIARSEFELNRAEVIEQVRSMLMSYSEAYSASDTSDSYVDCRNIDIALNELLTKKKPEGASRE